MKLQASLFAIFTVLLAVVSAATHKAYLTFRRAPRLNPQPYITEIYLPGVDITFHAGFWPRSGDQRLTKAAPGYTSVGYIEVNDVEALKGTFTAYITDNTQKLFIAIDTPAQVVQFVGESASDERVVGLEAKARIVIMEEESF